MEKTFENQKKFFSNPINNVQTQSRQMQANTSVNKLLQKYFIFHLLQFQIII